MPGSRGAGVAFAGPGPRPPAAVVLWSLSAASGSFLLFAFSSTVAMLIELSALPCFTNLALTQTEMHAFIITMC